LISFSDIGANLTDDVFNGVYSGTKKHDPDRTQVLDRAWQVGVQKIILTVGTIFDCAPAFKIAATDGECL
jgi:TatD DNase family protein